MEVYFKLLDTAEEMHCSWCNRTYFSKLEISVQSPRFEDDQEVCLLCARTKLAVKVFELILEEIDELRN